MKTQRAALIGLILALIFAFLPPAQAHETTRSYVTLTRDGTLVTMRLRIAFRDIEVAVWMDEDLDGRITWGEVRRRLDTVDAYVGAGFTLTAGGPCLLRRDGAGSSDSGGIPYLDLDFTAICPDAQAPLTVETRLLSEVDPDHRMFLTAESAGERTTTVLSAAGPVVVVTGRSGGMAAAFASYFRAGVAHLLAGPDHLVFLLVLILPAVCAPGSVRAAAGGVLAAVTGFTLAHAVTVSAAATELLRPPTALIEVLIALSIVLTAIDNLRPFLPGSRTAVAAFFGTIHGFGFATALGGLQLSAGALAVALMGFNLGIEAAQVAVVLASMPVLYMIGARRTMLWVGSAAAAVVGLVWAVTRILPLVGFG